MRHATSLRIVRELVTALAAEGVPSLLVKGVITAHVLYEDVAERSISDIDVRIRPRDYRKVLRIARARGWSSDTAIPALWEAMLQIEGCDVDLECTIGPPGLCAVSVAAMLGRAERHVAPFGFPHLQPELNDHALILVLNAFKDGLRPMPWAREDLRRIARHDRFDAGALIARAREGGVVTALWIVADWLAETHGAAEWRTIRERVGSGPPSQRAAATYRYVQRRGFPPKAGLLATACAGDNWNRCAAGFTLTALAIARRHALRAFHRDSPAR